MKTHEENHQLYIQLGGNFKTSKLYLSPTLANRAKMQAMVKKLQKENKPLPIVDDIPEQTKSVAPPVVKPVPETVSNTSPHHALLGLISEYPEELHDSYKKAFESWLNACSLKVQLNRVPLQDEKSAYDIQSKIHETMQQFDQAKKALDYYKENRSILPTIFKEDLSGKNDLELDRRLRSLRTQITRRAKTISSKTVALPSEDHPRYQARISALNKKIEELEVYRLEVQEITRIISERLKKKL